MSQKFTMPTGVVGDWATDIFEIKWALPTVSLLESVTTATMIICRLLSGYLHVIACLHVLQVILFCRLFTFSLNNYFIKRKCYFFFFSNSNKILITEKTTKTTKVEKKPHV